MITEKLRCRAPVVPILLHIGQFFPVTDGRFGRDLPTSQDPLPAALGHDADGYILSRETYVTDVKRETTDDN